MCSNSDIYRICVILMIKILNLDQLDLIGVKSTQKKNQKQWKMDLWIMVKNESKSAIFWKIKFDGFHKCDRDNVFDIKYSQY